MMAEEEGSWQTIDFHDPRRAALARRSLLQRAGTATFACALAFVVFLLAIQHQDDSCGQSCYDGEYRTHQGGHAWTGYDGAWQWQAQWLMGLGALICAVAALATTTRYGWRRRTAALTAAALLLSAGWILWRVLEPAVPA